MMEVTRQKLNSVNTDFSLFFLIVFGFFQIVCSVDPIVSTPIPPFKKVLTKISLSGFF